MGIKINPKSGLDIELEEVSQSHKEGEVQKDEQALKLKKLWKKLKQT